jgi:hypothetical protein
VSGWTGFAVWFWGRPVLRSLVIETQIRELSLPKSRYVVEVTPPQLLYCCIDASWNCAPATSKSEVMAGDRL